MNKSVKSRIIEQFQNVILSESKVTFYKDYDRNNVFIEKGSTGYIKNFKELCGTVSLLKFEFFETNDGREFPYREVKLFLFEAEKLLCDSSLFPFFFIHGSKPFRKALPTQTYEQDRSNQIQRILQGSQLENGIRISNYEYLEYVFNHPSHRGISDSKKFAMIAVKHKTRLPKKIEEVILGNYKLSNHYSSAFDINLTEFQQKEFLKDKTGSFAAKYSMDLIDRRIEVPDFLHNYLLSLKAFGNLSSIVEIKGNGEFVPSLNYFVEMYIKKSENEHKKNSE